MRLLVAGACLALAARGGAQQNTPRRDSVATPADTARVRELARQAAADSLVSRNVIVRGDTAWVWVKDGPRAVSSTLIRVERRAGAWVYIGMAGISIR
jgi:hypothetical protein